MFINLYSANNAFPVQQSGLTDYESGQSGKPHNLKLSGHPAKEKSMFTGIIQATGRADLAITASDAACLRVSFSKDPAVSAAGSLLAAFTADDFTAGESIAVNGVCLTLLKAPLAKQTTNPANAGTESETIELLFDVSAETLRRSNLGTLPSSAVVNLERSLRVGDRLGGHFVQGHVDAVVQLLGREDDGNSQRFRFSLPPEIRPFLAPKGSVTLDGISLTVGEVSEKFFTVYLIPHTLSQTSWRAIMSGAMVNCEVDCLARYVARIVSAKV